MLKIKEFYPILIVPSNYGEGLSRSIIEALSLKIPVICSQTALSGTFNEKNLFYTNRNHSFFYKNRQLCGRCQKFEQDNKSKMTKCEKWLL